MRLVSVSQMNQLEKEANQNGLSYEEMVARAGHGLAEIIHMRYSRDDTGKATGLVGSGNNGGDTLVALTHLAKWGWETHACLVKPRKENDSLVNSYQFAGGTIHNIQNQGNDLKEAADLIKTSDVMLDGILAQAPNFPYVGIKKFCIYYQTGEPDGVGCGSDCHSVWIVILAWQLQKVFRLLGTVCWQQFKKGLLRSPAYNGQVRSRPWILGLRMTCRGDTVKGEVADDRWIAKCCQIALLKPIRAHSALQWFLPVP